MLKHGLAAMLALGVSFVTLAKVDEVAVGLFGTTEGEEIAKGAVFVDGLLLKAPYKVVQKGNVILVNDTVVSRFEVLSAEEKKNAGTDEAAAEEETPPEPAATSSKPAKPRVMSVEERKEADKKKKELQAKFAEKSTFNIDPVSKDPNALFEEADYTFTPPKKEEPKAIPYVRPASVSGSERIAMQRARAEEMKAEREERNNPFKTVQESFESLSEAEIAKYKEQFVKRRETLEKVLKQDGMLFLASMNSGTAVFNKQEMGRFLVAFYKALPKDNRKLVPAMPKMNKAYVDKIWENRKANKAPLTAILKRLQSESKKD